jgi:hypothetical protein
MLRVLATGLLLTCSLARADYPEDEGLALRAIFSDPRVLTEVQHHGFNVFSLSQELVEDPPGVMVPQFAIHLSHPHCVILARLSGTGKVRLRYFTEFNPNVCWDFEPEPAPYDPTRASYAQFLNSFFAGDHVKEYVEESGTWLFRLLPDPLGPFDPVRLPVLTDGHAEATTYVATEVEPLHYTFTRVR